MLTVFGSTALDTIRTPTKTLKNVLGGAATFAGVSASFFVKTGLIAVVGSDFPKEHHETLSKYLDLRGLSIQKGKTFRYDGKYDNTLSTRETLKTELNVLADFKPTVPDEYRKSKFVYLANNDPEQNAALLKEFDNVKFSMCDTIEFWISTKPDAVKKMMSWGATYVIIKKGEHGSLMFYDDVIFPSAGFSLEDVVDPTGAGDSFAGAMIGYLASKNSTSLSSIKKAVVYGNVMGSFAVERYGLDGLLQVKKPMISKRIKTYEKMIRF